MNPLDEFYNAANELKVIVYNKALGYIQNYTPKDCYLLGRRIKLLLVSSPID